MQTLDTMKYVSFLTIYISHILSVRDAKWRAEFNPENGSWEQQDRNENWRQKCSKRVTDEVSVWQMGSYASDRWGGIQLNWQERSLPLTLEIRRTCTIHTTTTTFAPHAGIYTLNPLSDWINYEIIWINDIKCWRMLVAHEECEMIDIYYGWHWGSTHRASVRAFTIWKQRIPFAHTDT